jgi:hypothetical protein
MPRKPKQKNTEVTQNAFGDYFPIGTLKNGPKENGGEGHFVGYKCQPISPYFII